MRTDKGMWLVERDKHRCTVGSETSVIERIRAVFRANAACAPRPSLLCGVEN